MVRVWERGSGAPASGTHVHAWHESGLPLRPPPPLLPNTLSPLPTLTAEVFDYVNKYNQTRESVYPYKPSASACNTSILAATTPSQVIKTTTSPGYAWVAGSSATALKTAVAARPTVV